VTALVLIAAMDRNRAIGVDGGLPWHLPDDLKRFKALTLGKPVLMGRRTAQSLKRALSGRRNLVLTRGRKAPFAGMEAVSSVKAAIECARSPELMVIGGAEIYALTLEQAARLHFTEVHTVLPRADAWFPVWEAARWREGHREQHPADARHAFAFDFVDLTPNVAAPR
jgi:dihydrofolate reductase